jgi:hypothetical protein
MEKEISCDGKNRSAIPVLGQEKSEFPKNLLDKRPENTYAKNINNSGEIKLRNLRQNKG